MGRAIALSILLTVVFARGLFAQLPAADSIAFDLKGIPTIRPLHTYNEGEQRLLLELAFTYFTVVKQNEVNLDSSLLYCARSLGVSRMLVVGEAFPVGIPDRDKTWFDDTSPSVGIKMLRTAKGRDRLPLLLLLGAYYCFNPQATDRCRDSALNYLTQAWTETISDGESPCRRQSLCMMVKLFAQGGDLEKADSCSKVLVRFCEESGDRQTEVMCWMWRGLYTVFSPKTTANRIAWLERAIALYKKDDNKLGIINALTDKAYLEYASLNPDLAIRDLQTTLNLEDSIHFPFTHYSAEDLTDLGGPGRYSESLHYALSAVRTSKAAGDSVGWAVFYAQLAFLYTFDGFDSAALVWDRQAMRRILLTGDCTDLYQLMESIVMSETVGKKHEVLEELKAIHARCPPVQPYTNREYHFALLLCYQYLKDYLDGEKECSEVLRWQDSTELLRGPFDRAHTYEVLGVFYYDAGNWKKARSYLESSLKDPSHKTTSLPMRQKTQIILFKLDSADGRYADAIGHLEEASNIERENFTYQVNRDQDEIKIQYETGRKDQEITNRDHQIGGLEQRDKLRQANLRQANIIRNITVAAIGVLLFVGVLLYRQFRQRQKTAALIFQKNEQLQHVVSEKEWLLKEIHHRVKNNLHTIICLLESQAHYLENDALQAIEVSQHRIYAMSLLHQKIYQSADVKTINMASYVPEFVGYLWESFGSPTRITFDLSVSPLKLDIGQTIPIALIINEGVTNSIKYAFPGNRRGTISVSLDQYEGSIRLVVADDGVGMGPIEKEIEAKSLGLELIKGLTREMQGEVIFDTRAGTSITVMIPADISDKGEFDFFKEKNIVAT